MAPHGHSCVRKGAACHMGPWLELGRAQPVPHWLPRQQTCYMDCKEVGRSTYKEGRSPDSVEEKICCKGRQAGHLGPGQIVWVLENDLHATEDLS